MVSELPGFAWDFWRFGGLRDLIRWRSCVDLRSEVAVFVGSCVDLRRTQGVAQGICGEVDPVETQSRVSGKR